MPAPRQEKLPIRGNLNPPDCSQANPQGKEVT